MDCGKKHFKNILLLVCSFLYVKIEMVIKMKRLSYEDFDEAYQLFQEAFIPAELRPYDKMKTMFFHDDFMIYGYHRDGQLVGAMIVWEFDDFIYLENFAVSRTIRNHGIGRFMLQNIQKIYQNHLLILEVEKPHDDLSRRRIAFYQRLQFIHNPYHFIQPALRNDVQDVHLMIMSYPDSITFQSFEMIKQILFEKVYLQRM